MTTVPKRSWPPGAYRVAAISATAAALLASSVMLAGAPAARAAVYPHSPPVTLAKPGTPLTVNGTGPSAAILAALKKPNPYKTIYTCTVTVEEKGPARPRPAAKHKKGCEIKEGGRARCTKPVTLNTGFGGEAQQVKNHHPAG